MDLEGTLLEKDHSLDDGLVAPSAWTVLAEALGDDCLREEQASKDRWIQGGYSGRYVDWMKDTVDIHRRHGLKRDLYEKVLDRIEIMPGAAEAVSDMRDRGATTVVISGAFKYLADRVQRCLKIDHALSGCEYFFSEEGDIEHFNLLPTDEMGKVDFMQLVCKEYKVDPGACVFVGDGKNDVHLAQSVGFSIAFNAQQELQSVSNVSITQRRGREDFRAVVDMILRNYRGE